MIQTEFWVSTVLCRAVRMGSSPCAPSRRAVDRTPPSRSAQRTGDQAAVDRDTSQAVSVRPRAQVSEKRIERAPSPRDARVSPPCPKSRRCGRFGRQVRPCAASEGDRDEKERASDPVARWQPRNWWDSVRAV